MSELLFRAGLLEGKVALITGGGSGIGLQTAHDFAALGAEVWIASRKKKRIEEAAAGLSELLGTVVHPLVCDIRDRENITQVVETICTHSGKIDVLVNNGGGQFLSPAEHIRDKGWDSVIATNLTGTWNMTKAVAQASMFKNGGHILNITMTTGRGYPGMAHSVAARSGVEAMTKTLAVEWAKYGVKINCIQPGIIASSGMNNYPNGLMLAHSMQKEIPAKRLGSCAEVSQLLTFLASPGGDYVTGQVWTIDGGSSLWSKSWPIPDPKPLPEVVIKTWPWENED